MSNSQNKSKDYSSYIIDSRTRIVLNQKHRDFAEYMEEKPDEELLVYLRKCAEKLGYSPCVSEVIGGKYIALRLGNWSRALDMAGLKRAGKPPESRHTQIYKDEYKHQMHLAKMERQRRKEEQIQERNQRLEAAQARKEERIRRDMLWGQEHAELSDEELLEYVRVKAKEYGYTPFSREVEGGEYIAERFCGWPMVLTLAGLPLPKGMKPPKPAKQEEYIKKQKGNLSI